MTSPFGLSRVLPVLSFGLALLAGPVTAQDVVIVPLDPIDPGEVETGTMPPLQILPGELPTDEPLPPDMVLPEAQAPEGEASEPLGPGSVVGEDVMTVDEDVVAIGTGAVLRGLDKLAGTVEDLPLARGDTVGFGWLEITLGECRYPVGNPSGDAYAWLVIREQTGEAPIFEGWMIASSPALNALDHPRFDVWVINCTTE